MFWRVYGLVLGLSGGLFVANYGGAAESAVGANAIRPEEAAEGWLLVFDGQTLFGWRPMPEGAWQAADSLLQAKLGQATKAEKAGQPDPKGQSAPPARLVSTSEWADFVLRMDFRVDPGAQASLWLRSTPEAKDPNADGYEVVLASEDPAAWPPGSLKSRKKSEAPALPSGWRTLEAQLEAGVIHVRLDGQEVLRWDDPKPIRRGNLVLEVRKGSAAFRSIKLRPLGLRSIFNGKDLTGWKPYPQTPTKCSVTSEGCLRLQGGRGQLESEGQYADFTLQLDVFVNGQELNSGVFFRCIPGEMMNGYECQIHNGFLDGDRNKPKDCGTGGIFRRQNARRVAADDFQWFTLTIHAQGPHVATWVNGYPTADWTDARPADPNPRKGRRLEPGTLQIQGHDPSTDLMFRNIRVVELPGR